MRLLRFVVSLAAAVATVNRGAGAQTAAPRPAPATLQVPDDFEVVPVALPPLVTFPMLGSFDDRGRLFLAENAGVNLDEKELEANPPSRITMLEDVDGDGVFDRSSVFADRLAFPMGAVWHDGALFVTSAPGLWRLEDRDGDGRAEVRRLIATGFKSTGNAADVHGPFLHPNGRLYWCHGRKGHEVYQNSGGALVSKGLGARVWSCRPDGSDIQVHAGGGMDNPVEVAFNQEGEIFGTVNIFRGAPRSDAVVHWVHGGVYPRTDQEPVLAEFRRSGELLPPVTLLGHVAPSGIALPRSDRWGPEYRDNLFLAEFNTRRIMRVPLERHGASYRGRPLVFATAAETGVHFTDVLEDADGSLLVVDTGAWFRRGCPTSVVARADITGGIYRIRRKGEPAPVDPRGRNVRWHDEPPAVLAGLLGDPRPAVRDRAVTELARRGADSLAALGAVLEGGDTLARSNAVWALIRIATPDARAAVRRALRDADARVREVACQGAFVTEDRAATELLIARLADEALPVQREAARALGRLRDPRAVPALGGACAIPRDPILTHALVHALIEIDAPGETRRLLSHREPLARRAALIALDQGSRGALDAAPVFAALADSNHDLRQAALQIAVRHPEWGGAAADFLAASHPALSAAATREIVARLLPVFLVSPEVREWVRGRLAAPGATPALEPELLLEAIAGSAQAWDEAWRPLIVEGARRGSPGVSQAALRAATTHRKRDFSGVLREIGADASRPTPLRVAALQLAAGGGGALDVASFDLVLEPFRTGGQPEARLQAAGLLAGARLTRAQLLALADVLPQVGPMELQQLLGAFQRGPGDPEVGARLLARLRESNARWGVQQTTLQAVFQRYPAPAYENAAPMIAEIMNQNVARDGRVAELEVLAAGGDAARGRAAFLAGAGACLSCHRVGDTGGVLGPDLSQIGRIRTVRDLVEAIGFPNASIARGYESFLVSLTDGTTLLGTIPRETGDALIVLSADSREQAVPRATVAKVEPAPVSLMPSGLDRAMEPKVFADLIAYFQSLR